MLQTKLNDREAKELPDFDLCDQIWSLVIDAHHADVVPADVEPLCDYPESIYAAKLSPHWRHAYMVHAFEYDVLAGGLSQFFWNHRGLTNAETVEALTEIGCEEHAKVLKRACEVFEAHKPLFSGDIVEEFRQNELESSFNQSLAPLNSELWALRNNDPREALAKYIRTNLVLFQNQK